MAIREPGKLGKLSNGNVRCPECGRWCVSMKGLRIHGGKSHSRRKPLA